MNQIDPPWLLGVNKISTHNNEMRSVILDKLQQSYSVKINLAPWLRNLPSALQEAQYKGYWLVHHSDSPMWQGSNQRLDTLEKVVTAT